MAKTSKQSRFSIVRDDTRCIKCQVCVRMCSFDTHSYDATQDTIITEVERCVGCCFCVEMCPTKALRIIKNY